MGHTVRDKAKLLGRVRRAKGQVEAVERALEQEADCGDVLRLIAACRGAMNALMAEVLERHLREHVVPARGSSTDGANVVEELIDIIRAYLK
jgi:FrmR/RcnR family transcriptional regulator, repressor of frmRAB operon